MDDYSLEALWESRGSTRRPTTAAVLDDDRSMRSAGRVPASAVDDSRIRPVTADSNLKINDSESRPRRKSTTDVPHQKKTRVMFVRPHEKEVECRVNRPISTSTKYEIDNEYETVEQTSYHEKKRKSESRTSTLDISSIESQSEKHGGHTIKDYEALMREHEIIKAGVLFRKRKPGPLPEVLLKRIPRKKLLAPLKVMSIVTNSIVLGSYEDAQNIQAMQLLGISHVLDLTRQNVNKAAMKFLNYKKVHMPLENDSDAELCDFYEEAAEFILHTENAGGRVVVYCFSGAARAASIVIMYLIEKHKVLLKQAYNHVRNVRPTIQITNNFKLQLAEFEFEVLGRSTVQRNVEHTDWDFYEWNRVKHRYGRQKSFYETACCFM